MGKQALDAVVLEMGHMVAESVMLIEREDVRQNLYDRLQNIIASFSDRFTIIHLTSLLDLSRVLKVGIKKITGDIVGFPDNDCWYPRDLLKNVIRSLELGHRVGVTGRVICQDAQVRLVALQSFSNEKS